MFKRFLFLGIAITIAMPANAQTLGQGYERVAVDDGRPRVCIDARTDHVSVRLERVVVAKSKGWFSSDSTVDVIVNGQITKRDASYNKSQAKMPMVFRADIDEYDGGTVVTSVSKVLLSKYPLSNGGSTVDLLEIDFSFVNASSPTTLTRIITSLPNAAQSLPIPVSPYSQAFISASKILSDVVDSAIQDEEFADDVVRERSLPLEFNETGQCGSNGAFAGSYTFFKNIDAPEQNGIIKTDDINKYCFIKFESSSAVFVEKKDAGGACTYQPDKASRLLNPHFTVVVSITNAGASPAQNREIVGSGWSLSRRNAAGTILNQTTAYDLFALKRAFNSAGLGDPKPSFAGDQYELVGGEVKYSPNPNFPPVEKFNFTRAQLDANPKMFEDISEQKIDPEEIVLNSISRCTAYGVDVIECF